MRRRKVLLGVVGTCLIGMLATTASVFAVSSNLFAVIASDGSLIAGPHVTSVSHTVTGQYEVTFDTGVGACAYVATTRNVFSQALLVFTAGGHLSNNGVYVETKNQGGGLTDGPFSIVVDCGHTGMKYAVVGYHANLVRSTTGAVLNHLGVGRYTLRFATSVASCAYLATVGDPHHALVFSPNNVSTGSRPDLRKVYVETKNPGGGLSDGIPFHLAVICPSAPSARVAVVRANGLIARGSSLTSSFRAGTGEYAVVTNRSITSCAQIGTRGSTDNSVPFSPATVETVSGPAANAAGFEVRQLLFFGGAPSSQAFHAALVC
jgi:hypothetical protein